MTDDEIQAGAEHWVERKFLDYAEQERDALRAEVERMRQWSARAVLCLSGFVGEGISLDGHDDPADVYFAALPVFGVDDAEALDAVCAALAGQQGER